MLGLDFDEVLELLAGACELVYRAGIPYACIFTHRRRFLEVLRFAA